MEPETTTVPTSAETAPITTPQPPATTTEDNSLLMGILCYLGILAIIPYLVAKDNSFVHYHLKQGIVLVAIEVVLFVVGNMMALGMLWPVLSLINLGCLVLSIIGIINVVHKKEVPLPLVGGLSVHVKI